jgi:hypothetical protein
MTDGSLCLSVFGGATQLTATETHTSESRKKQLTKERERESLGNCTRWRHLGVPLPLSHYAGPCLVASFARTCASRARTARRCRWASRRTAVRQTRITVGSSSARRIASRASAHDRAKSQGGTRSLARPPSTADVRNIPSSKCGGSSTLSLSHRCATRGPHQSRLRPRQRARPQ